MKRIYIRHLIYFSEQWFLISDIELDFSVLLFLRCHSTCSGNSHLEKIIPYCLIIIIIISFELTSFC